MPRRPITLLVTFLALAIGSGCAAHGSHSMACSSAEVSSNAQPGGATARKALEAYLKIDRTGLPKSGYRVDGHFGTRYIFVSGDHRVSVTKLPTDKSEPAVWVVNLTFDCS